jgi:hypothetical protein
MSNDLPHDAIPPADKVETALRVAVLGALYAAAIFVVVAFSPSMGFVASHPSGEVGRVASADEPVRR